MRYFLMGAGWRSALPWPPSSPERTERIELKGGSYDYDPAHPFHTLGGRNGAECIQNQNVTRADILTTVGPELTTAINLTGKAIASLWVSSDADSADFMVKLIDVAPNGFAAPLLDSARPVVFNSKRPQRVTIELGNTRYLLPPGHRVA